MEQQPTVLRLVQGGIAEWNDARQTLREQSTGGSLDDPFDLHLGGEDFSGLDLSEGDLSDIDFRGAFFRSSRLVRADFSRGCLDEAKLNSAHLIGTDFSLASVTGCDFTGAVMGDTRLVRLDLSQAQGLDRVVHRFASVVDVSTLERTARSLLSRREPGLAVWSFLRAAGVPEHYIVAAADSARDE